MKNLVAINIFLWICHLGFAQPVTIDNVPVPVEFYRLPDEPLDPSFTTYSSEVEARFGGLSTSGYTESSLEDEYLNLSGYKEVSRDGDVEIEASIGDFNVYGERTDFRRHKKKDKNGKETTTTTYAKEIKYSLPIAIKVVDKKGHTLEDEYIYSWTDQETYTTSYYKSLSELDSYWRYNRTSKLSELQKNKIRDGFTKIYNLINNKYGYRLINENTRFETIGKKKHPDFDAYQQALETIKEAFQTMDADKGISGIKTMIKPSLDFYNVEGKKYVSKSKDDLRLSHINLYNQALAYFWLEDFEKATMFAKEIQKMNSKDKDAKRLLEDIEYVVASLERAGKKSRHGTMVGGKT